MLSVSGVPGWAPLRACGSPGSPRYGPLQPRGIVRRLVDRQGVAESSRVQCSPSGCRLLSSAVRVGALLPRRPGQRVGEGHCCHVPADQRHGRALLPRSSLIEVSSPSYGLDGTGVDPRLGCVARHGWRWLGEGALAMPSSAVLRQLLGPSRRVLPGRLVWPAWGAWPGRATRLSARRY